MINSQISFFWKAWLRTPRLDSTSFCPHGVKLLFAIFRLPHLKNVLRNFQVSSHGLGSHYPSKFVLFILGKCQCMNHLWFCVPWFIVIVFHLRSCWRSGWNFSTWYRCLGQIVRFLIIQRVDHICIWRTGIWVCPLGLGMSLPLSCRISSPCFWMMAFSSSISDRVASVNIFSSRSISEFHSTFFEITTNPNTLRKMMVLWGNMTCKTLHNFQFKGLHRDFHVG